MMTYLATVLICFFVTVNCQWIQNHTVIQNHYAPGFRTNYTVINTTTVIQQNHGYGPAVQQPQYGFRPNVTRFDPYRGYVNRSSVGSRNGNNLIVGTPGPNDVVLFNQYFNKPSRWLQIREKIITYPTNPWANKYQYTITAVAVFDLSKVPGGHATILTGGPGHRNVTIRLFSDRSTGFNFKVVIHGR